MVVFHRNAKVKDTAGFAFDDPTGLMEWAAADRAIVKLRGSGDLASECAAIKDLVARWVRV